MVIVFDQKQMKPGCVLLQVAMGGTVPSELFNKYFPSQFWEVGITPDMKPYTVTEAELPIISQLMEKHNAKKTNHRS